MRRQVYLYSGPLTDLSPWLQPGMQVVLPNRLSARTYDITQATTLEALAEAHLTRRQLAVASPLVITRVLQELPATGGELASPLSLLAPIRELLDTGPVLDTLSPRDYPVIAELMTLAQHYRKALSAQGLVDPAERFWHANPNMDQQAPMLVYGYPWLDRGALTFINAVSGGNSVVFLPLLSGDLGPEGQESLLFLEENGWQVSRHKEPRSGLSHNLLARFNQDPALPLEAAQASAHGTLEAEIRSTLAQIKHRVSQGTPLEDIAIIPSDLETYQPLLEAITWEYGLPLSFSNSTLLKKTLLGTWLEQVGDVIDDRFPYEATLRLLQHPLGPKLEKHQLDQIYRQHPVTKSSWLSLELAWLGLLDWPDKASRAEWKALLNNLLTFEKTEAALSQWPLEKAAQTLLLETLTHWADTNPEESVPHSGVLHELNLMLQVLSVGLETETGGVAVLAPEQAVGGRVSHLYLLGLMENYLPAPPKNVTALSFQTRNRLVESGIPIKSLVKQARQEALRFYGLLHCPTESLWLSYPKLVNNKAQLPSPYFDALRLDLRPTAELPPCSTEEGRRQWLFETDWHTRDTLAKDIEKAWTIEHSREFSEIQDEYDGVTGLPIDWQTHLFTATQLTSFGQCAFRWWAGYALKLANPDESDEALSASIKGSFYHKVLELAFEKAAGAKSLTEAVPAHLEEAFAEAERQLRMPIIIPSWKIMRQEHLSKLRQLADTPELYGEVTEVLSLEQNFEGTWQGLRIRGKVDRIDRTEKGTVVIDYKTSGQAPAGVQDDYGKAILDIQLPVYMEAALPKLIADAPAKDAYYFSLTKGKILARLNPEQQSALDRFAERVKSRFESGTFPVEPDIDGKACNYCDFDLLCRQSGRLAIKTGEVGE